MRPLITYSVFTNEGGREVNEDSVGASITERGECFVLCDGLGGMGMGDAASQTVVSAVVSYIGEMGGNPKCLSDAFEAAQQILLMEQSSKNAKSKMKTTATVVLTDKRKAYIGHVGDSRVYIFKDGKVLKRTLDHSIPQMLAITGEIQESEIRTHKERNIVLRVMGEEWDSPMYELMKPIPLRKCQAFLLCSDGFWELIEDADMEHLLSVSSSVEDWINRMADLVRKNGVGKNMDNFSAIGVWVNK